MNEQTTKGAGRQPLAGAGQDKLDRSLAYLDQFQRGNLARKNIWIFVQAYGIISDGIRHGGGFGLVAGPDFKSGVT